MLFRIMLYAYIISDVVTMVHSQKIYVGMIIAST